MADDWQNCLHSQASCFSALQKHRDKILPDSVARWFSFRSICTFGCTHKVCYILADGCLHKVTSSLCACTKFFPRTLLACTELAREKTEGRKSICQHGIDHVRKNSVCILLHMCLKSQHSCWLMFIVSGQGEIGNRMVYKSGVWPPSESYTVSEAA